MAMLEEINTAFKAMNVHLNRPVLEKCAELCITYNIDSEDFLDQWLAYTTSKLNGEPPSLDALNKMERRELQKQSRNLPRTPKARCAAVIETTPIRQPIQTEISEQIPIISPTQVTPSQQFTQRADARSVQCQFGDCSLDSFRDRCGHSPAVKVENEESASGQYMYEKFLLRQQSINSITRWVVGEIVSHNKLELTQEKLKDYSGEMVIGGRVYSEGSGRLNLQSLVLEGTLEVHKGHTIKLNVANLDKLALFSGQIVVVKGNNMKSNFVVTQLYTGAPLAPPEKPFQLDETLQIVAASGPFTFPDNLLYEPLEDLLKYVVEFKPNLLILTGPFVEVSHPILQTTNESYDSFFENILEGITERLRGHGVQVVVIPSHKDVHNHPIFPTPPCKTRKRFDNLILAPNPCTLDVGGLVVGASSADVLFHISKTEVFKDHRQKGGGDRMARLASHIFNQRNFYPLHPPDLNLRVDYQLLERAGMLECSPHLMFLPSNLRHFVKKTEGCVVVNPERLTKGHVAGTFARVEVRPGEGEICDRVSCQVLRV